MDWWPGNENGEYGEENVKADVKEAN